MREYHTDAQPILDRNEGQIRDMGGADHVLSKPLIKKELLCQIIFQKSGFELKLVEQINDDIGKEKDTACKIMFEKLYPPVTDAQPTSVRRGGADAMEQQDRAIDERRRIRQDLEDVPNVESYEQLKNIAWF